MTISFQDILDALMLEPDRELFDYTVERAKSERQRGYIGRQFQERYDAIGFAVQLTPQKWFEHARRCGQSKQVAREYEANRRQNAIDAIKDALASGTRNAPQVAQLTQYLYEAALRIASELERRGYTVTNWPGGSSETFHWRKP